MNRRQRRGAIVAERKRLSPTEAAETLATAGRMCGWQGCTEHYHGPQPADWVNLIVYHSAQPDLLKLLAKGGAACCTIRCSARSMPLCLWRRSTRLRLKSRTNRQRAQHDRSA